jgi:hypothetical protein
MDTFHTHRERPGGDGKLDYWYFWCLWGKTIYYRMCYSWHSWPIFFIVIVVTTKPIAVIAIIHLIFNIVILFSLNTHKIQAKQVIFELNNTEYC